MKNRKTRTIVSRIVLVASIVLALYIGLWVLIAKSIGTIIIGLQNNSLTFGSVSFSVLKVVLAPMFIKLVITLGYGYYVYNDY